MGANEDFFHVGVNQKFYPVGANQKFYPVGANQKFYPVGANQPKAIRDNPIAISQASWLNSSHKV